MYTVLSLLTEGTFGCRQGVLEQLVDCQTRNFEEERDKKFQAPEDRTE